MGMTVYTVDSFVKADKGGNPAGVVLNAESLSTAQMLDIARQAGFSETAFVQKSAKATFKVRFFTPHAEVDLCGHATIAAFALLRSKEIIGNGVFSQETKAGILNIIVDNGLVYMSQALPRYYEILDKAELAASLNISPDDCLIQLPVQIVSTGLKDIMVPVKNLDVLFSIQPDEEKIAELSEKYHVVGFHVFSLETKFGATAHCRNFAPLYNIAEESATGTASGALACYLYNYRVVEQVHSPELVFEQGYSMGKPAEILVRLQVEGDAIQKVWVGGNTMTPQNFSFQ